jgi:hypothetical protein
MSIRVDMGWRKREDTCRYGVEEEERYVLICDVVLDSRQGEELGESYTSSVNPIIYIYISILVFLTRAFLNTRALLWFINLYKVHLCVFHNYKTITIFASYN